VVGSEDGSEAEVGSEDGSEDGVRFDSKTNISRNQQYELQAKNFKKEENELYEKMKNERDYKKRQDLLKRKKQERIMPKLCLKLRI
jgi:hypothetical protein